MTAMVNESVNNCIEIHQSQSPCFATSCKTLVVKKMFYVRGYCIKIYIQVWATKYDSVQKMWKTGVIFMKQFIWWKAVTTIAFIPENVYHKSAWNTRVFG